MLQNYWCQELERSLGAAALHTDCRVATCQLNALDHSSKETPNRFLWWKVLGCVPWVADGSNAGGCVKGSLGRRSSRILDFEVVYGTSQVRGAAWPNMLVSNDLRLLVLTRSEMDVARRASWLVPVLRTSELHGERTARRPTLFSKTLFAAFFSRVVAPSCWLNRSEHRVCGSGHSRQDFLVTVSLGGVARKLLFARRERPVCSRAHRGQCRAIR